MNKYIKQILIFNFIIFSFMLSESVHAKVIQMRDGRMISGEVVNETDEHIFLESQKYGAVMIEKALLKRESKHEKKMKVAKTEVDQWQKKLSVGLGRTSGNTKHSEVSAEGLINYNSGHDETTLKWRGYYSTEDEKLTGKKYYGMTRYAYSFGKKSKWYHFFKLEGDQDRFANIHYRVIPSTGVGLWLCETKKLKAMLEVSVLLKSPAGSELKSVI